MQSQRMRLLFMMYPAIIQLFLLQVAYLTIGQHHQMASMNNSCGSMPDDVSTAELGVVDCH